MATPIGVFCESKESLRSPRADSRRDIIRKHGDLVRVTQLECDKNFSYQFGEKYPGLIIGHDKCKGGESELVPKYMGWLWNIETVGIDKIRKGWCPGAVSTPVKEIMKSFLNPCPFSALKDEVGNIKCDDEDENQGGKESSFCKRCSQKDFKDCQTQYDLDDAGIQSSEDIKPFDEKEIKIIKSEMNEDPTKNHPSRPKTPTDSRKSKNLTDIKKEDKKIKEEKTSKNLTDIKKEDEKIKVEKTSKNDGHQKSKKDDLGKTKADSQKLTVSDDRKNKCNESQRAKNFNGVGLSG